ncbi:sulfatase family protein [Paenibacillus sp. UNC451MF]|uniref:sulfatase family protein n=1 Tax=Paenibacillus sp. UNC451MF TaxID=1449063 RepID=UPI00048C36A3|nr:sulfatase-like hydrolase/transferase [Paenibacillus sp. UNC451MF]
MNKQTEAASYRNIHRPNILLISTDTQRCDTLRCMGNPNAVSPNIDRLAAEGVMFTQAHTSSPVCMPARCSLLTGLHTPIHGCIENGTKRYADLPVFPDYLKEQGYTNLMIGKTHFGPIPDSFDFVCSSVPNPRNHNDPYIQHLAKHGYSQPVAAPNPIPKELYFESFLVDTAMDEITKATSDGNGPFFAFVSMNAPHSPYVPPKEWANAYDDIPLPQINYTDGELEHVPVHLKRMLGILGEEQQASVRLSELLDEQSETRCAADAVRRLYYSFAAYCDEQVGRLIDFLDSSGLRDNTLVIFTTDHGHELFDHGVNDKHNYYDSSWRIPFIMSMPGTLPQGEVRDFAIWNDITTTILAAAGTKCDTMQGFDLYTPLIEGLPSPRRCAVATLYKSAAVATARWKLEYYFEESEGRLYDRLNDPKEQKDLFKDSDYSEIRTELVEALLSWRSDIADLNHLIKGTGGGGPVAKRIRPHSLSMAGTDTEQRLNEKAQHIDLREVRKVM